MRFLIHLRVTSKGYSLQWLFPISSFPHRLDFLVEFFFLDSPASTVSNILYQRKFQASGLRYVIATLESKLSYCSQTSHSSHLSFSLVVHQLGITPLAVSSDKVILIYCVHMLLLSCIINYKLALPNRISPNI